MTDDRDPKRFERAVQFGIRSCSCGCVHIDLYDDESHPFASLCFAPGDAEKICAIIRTEAAKAEEKQEIVH